MAACVLLGNLALVVDAGSCRVAMATNRASGGCVGGGKNRHPELSMFRLTRRDPAATTPTTARPVAFYDHADAAGVPTAFPRIVCRRRRGDLYRVAAAVGSGWDGGNDADGKDNSDWEEGLQHRLKELEEMKELEKRAAELVAERAAADGEETEGEKRERVRRELEKVAREQAEGRKTAMLMFELGQKAYGRGMYSRAIDFLEAALTIIPRPTLFGGEIQIWLAMAYDANNRHRDCIDLYQQLEKQHPCISIRRQASELRYILEAPKLKISKDEMVTIPLIGSSYDRYAGSWSDKYKNRERRRKTMKTNQIPPTNDSWFDFLVRRPPTELAKNRAFWVTVTLWLALIGTALLLQR